MSRLQAFPLGNVYGGVSADFPDAVIPENTASKTDNWVLRKTGLEFAKGWVKFTDQKLTQGIASDVNLKVIAFDEFFKNDGTSQLIAFTNKRAYYLDDATTDLWIPFTPVEHLDTTVDADSAAAAATLNVASTTGYAANDRIIVHEGGAREEELVISVVNAGVSFTTTTNLVFTHTAVQADPVRKLEHRSIVDSDSAAAGTTLNVDTTAAHTVGEMILVGRGTGRDEYLVIDSITAGVSLTVSRPSWAPAGTGLQYTHTAAQADTVIRMADLVYSSDADDESSTIAEDVFYFCSFAHAVMKWDGSTEWAEKLTGLKAGDSVEGYGALAADYRARLIYSFEGFLILAHVQEDGTAIPQKIRWSRFGNFTSWVNNTDGSGQAGAFLFIGADFIVSVAQLKRELLFYRERSIEAMSYIGPPDIMGFRRAETGTGALSADGIIDLGDKHVFIGPDNVWEYNGINLVAIGDAIKDDFYDRLAPAQRDNVTMFLVEETDEAYLTFSTADQDNHEYGYIYNTVFGKWSGPRDLSAVSFGYYTEQANATWDGTDGTWDASTEIWDSRTFVANSPINLMGSNDGYIYQLEEGITKDGTAISATYETKLTDCGTSEIVKRLQRVKIGMREQGVTSVSVYVGTAYNVGDNLTWYGPFTLSMGADQIPFVYPDVTGRYFKVRVVSATTANIRDVEMFYMPRAFR